MIHIAVVARGGQPLAGAPSASFGPAGGTIGRTDSNTLVLDDPDRTVSRVHAQVLCRDGRFFVVDRGSNPMQCNGQVLGAGNEMVLGDGDRLVIGSFELRVSHAFEEPAMPADAPRAMAPMHAAPAAPPQDDPFADLLAGLGPAPSPPSAPARAAPAPPAVAPPAFADPLGMAAPPHAARADDPFADLLGSPAAPSPTGAGRATGALDDFSDLGLNHAAAQAAGADTIDALFGGIGAPGLGGDPLALSPLADPLRQPNTAASQDPLAAFGQAAPDAPAPRANHVSALSSGYAPPKAQPAPDTPAAPDLADIPPTPRFDDITGAPLGQAAPVAMPPAIPAVIPPVIPAIAPPAGPRATDDELLAAFLRGLGGTHQAPAMLTPALMERMGALLRAATEGTLQLLLARQEFKREVRAEVTLIASQANNPLKFSPTAEVALSHLLGPGVRGFMPAEAAMRDAYHDLLAHQFGVMVGLRAALSHVIGRFEPAELEKKIAARSALDNLFASGRKARLWDQFVALYGGIAGEAQDDFHALFGQAFLEAYEAQMARLKAAEQEAR